MRKSVPSLKNQTWSCKQSESVSPSMTSNLEPLALLFPGQGAHQPPMLDGLKNCRNFTSRYSLICECLGSDPLERFCRGDVSFCNENKVSSLLTVLASSLSLDLLRAQSKHQLLFFAGYSVGQWTSLYAAGALSFDELIGVVSARADLMDRAIQRCPGGMIAVIGLREDVISGVCDQLRNQGHKIWISNFNAPGQFSLSGTEDSIEEALRRLRELSPKTLIRLPVCGPWHCPLLREAGEGLRTVLRQVNWLPWHAPVIDNVSGSFLPMKKDRLVEQLVQHVSAPVRWAQGVEKLIGAGCAEFVEIGYGNTLTKFGFFINRSVRHRAFHCT